MWERPSGDVRRREIALSSLALVTMTVDAFASLALLRLGLPNGSQGWPALPVLLLTAPILPIATLGFAIWALRAKKVRPISAILTIVVGVCGLGVVAIAGLFWLVTHLLA